MMASVDQIATPKLLKALQYLGRAAEGYRLAEAPFVALPEKTHSKTARKLKEKDYAVCSVSIVTGKPEYKITSRGVTALAQIAALIEKRPRNDGLCKNGCGRAAYISPKGVKGYKCQVCLNEALRLQYARKGGRVLRADQPCSKCGGKRHISSGGIASAYCLDCRREKNLHHMREYKARISERVAKGETVMCVRCPGVPVVVTRGGYVQAYCRACLRAQKAKHRKLIRLRRIKQQMNRLQKAQ